MFFIGNIPVKGEVSLFIALTGLVLIRANSVMVNRVGVIIGLAGTLITA